MECKKRLSNLKLFLNKVIGLDEAVTYTVLARLIQGLGGIISVLFIANYLGKGEQGYFYTFNSILALQVFFELGITTIITQFTSKYFAQLTLTADGYIEGEERNKSYVASLLHFSIKWFLFASLGVFVFLSIVGYYFFKINNREFSTINWQSPWLLTTFSTSIILLSAPVLAFLEGIGQVSFASKLRFYQYTSQLALFFFLLILDTRLYARPISVICSVGIVFLGIRFSKYFMILKRLWRSRGEFSINYRNDIFPFQWKISLSWLSGYLIYQLFNPVIFAYEGAEMAGKMGMTLTVTNGILTIAMSWINTKVPSWSNLIATKQYKKLDKNFYITNLQSFFICLLGILIFLSIIFMMKLYHIEYLYRFLDFRYIIVLGAVTLGNLLISSLALYLRCHLKEPLLNMSLVIGILTALSTLLLGKYYGMSGVFYSYAIIILLISLPWTYFVFIKNKKEWH